LTEKQVKEIRKRLLNHFNENKVKTLNKKIKSLNNKSK